MAPPFVPEPGSPVVTILGMNVVQLLNLPIFLPHSDKSSQLKVCWPAAAQLNTRVCSSFGPRSFCYIEQWVMMSGESFVSLPQRTSSF